MSTTSARDALLQRMMTFHRANTEAMNICDRGVADYVSARCLLLSGLIPQGLTLAAQAVEKVLKSQYRIRGGTKPFGGRGGLGHAIPGIAQELLSDPTIQFDLSQFNSLFDRLVINYELRYPDNWGRMGLTNWSQSTNEIRELDVLVLHLFDDFPVPDEVNMLTCYFGIVANHLASPDNPFTSTSFQWLSQNNDAISAEWDRIRQDCEAMNAVAAPSGSK